MERLCLDGLIEIARDRSFQEIALLLDEVRRRLGEGRMGTVVEDLRCSDAGTLRHEVKSKAPRRKADESSMP